MPAPTEPVSFLRRMAAIFYDTLLIGVSTAILGGILATLISHALNVPLQSGSGLSNLLFIADLAIAFALFGWFWTHGGQTLGMRAWKIRVVTEQGHALDWQQAFFRFVGALFSWLALGVGYWIALFDPEKLTWHDRLSRTRLVRV